MNELRDCANGVFSALFQRSLAELRYLGLVRGTRKKADHVMKISWKGV
jgi:origin recognition complex subunit 3